MRVLPRTVLKEVLLLGSFYAAVYLGLILAGAAMPLIKQGAPIGAVLAFIPEQALLLSLLALPLAMVTAFLACIGRMREDGELTALQAAGVGTWQVARATLPIAILLAVWMGVAAHLLLPGLTLRLFEGRGQLLRQALAAKVERRTPVWQEDTLVLAAHGAEDDRLIGLFGVQIDKDEGLSAVFAPEARWTADPGDDDETPALGLEMRQARLMVREAGEPPRVATAVLPSWSVRIPTGRGNYQDKADSLSTAELLKRIRSAPEKTPREQRAMRNYERAWHTRLMLPVAIIALWAFSCGLALAVGRGNRMLSVCLGIVTVVAVLFPAMVLAKEVGERLLIDAAVWVWPPPLIIGAVGAWLLRRHR
ncbi:MAG: LptF/LptG family permease [Planctomycetes bacterium]|nr:LptF/LptG family permease [Planctomycetota bacterium]